jgi:hypothetical protein
LRLDSFTQLQEGERSRCEGENGGRKGWLRLHLFSEVCPSFTGDAHSFAKKTSKGLFESVTEEKDNRSVRGEG